ncbi:hypothetical protein A2714_01645 [Candidatus Woesebacteria bacterium RIFCSPHIGHO2_01_FULL_38_9]|uniref:PIN domain-containing protein n=2 Tax=Candidatus Woeseibacteriota TaxID=1752722 RepID=A0A1F7XZD8_9BACT|nr:MAG: hypothetical protein A2714_01645 [Candidatus Woesebacteria bacterium RIFCSPHIGHO2_01_FULL_38_9]OGM59351.1 MAG: hypothetical protein A3A75_03285 [Candidatus Woesebacteria bacterium RIFCSPLOWO2_01_FULL_39_10]
MKRIFVDTNAYSLLLRGDKKIESEISVSDEVLISVISLGEIYFGYYQGGLLQKNLENLDAFLGKDSVLTVKVNKNISFIYGQTKYELEKKGVPIPSNDIWIAASCIETDSVLITYDRHFLNIPKVKVWKKLT